MVIKKKPPPDKSITDVVIRPPEDDDDRGIIASENPPGPGGAILPTDDKGIIASENPPGGGGQIIPPSVSPITPLTTGEPRVAEADRQRLLGAGLVTEVTPETQVTEANRQRILGLGLEAMGVPQHFDVLPGGDWIGVTEGYARNNPEAVIEVGGGFFRKSIPTAEFVALEEQGLKPEEIFAQALPQPVVEPVAEVPTTPAVTPGDFQGGFFDTKEELEQLGFIFNPEFELGEGERLHVVKLKDGTYRAGVVLANGWEALSDGNFIDPQGSFRTAEEVAEMRPFSMADIEVQFPQGGAPFELFDDPNIINEFLTNKARQLEEAIGQVFPVKFYTDETIDEFYGFYTSEVDGDTIFRMGDSGDAVFIEDMRRIGRTAGTENLIRQVLPGITDNDIRLIFGELPIPTYDEWKVDREEGFTIKIGPLDVSIDLPWAGSSEEDYANWLESLDKMPVAGRAFTAGMGQLTELLAGGARWLEADGVAAYLSEVADPMLRLTIPDVTPGEVTWQDVYVGVWQAAPTFVALAAPTLLAYAGVGAVTGGLGWGPLTSFIAQTVFGGIVGAGMEATLEAGATYDAALAQGLSPSDAHDAAQQVFVNNLKLLGITNTAELGVFMLPGLKTVKAAASAGFIRTITSAAGQLIIQSVTEAGEEFFQDRIQREALGEEIVWDEQAQLATLIGFAMGFGTGGVRVIIDIQNNIISRLTPEQREVFNAGVATSKVENPGFTIDQHNTKGLDPIIETADGKKIAEGVLRQNEINEYEKVIVGEPVVEPTPEVTAEVTPTEAIPEPTAELIDSLTEQQATLQEEIDKTDVRSEKTVLEQELEDNKARVSELEKKPVEAVTEVPVEEPTPEVTPEVPPSSVTEGTKVAFKKTFEQQRAQVEKETNVGPAAEPGGIVPEPEPQITDEQAETQVKEIETRLDKVDEVLKSKDLGAAAAKSMREQVARAIWVDEGGRFYKSVEALEKHLDTLTDSEIKKLYNRYVTKEIKPAEMVQAEQLAAYAERTGMRKGYLENALKAKSSEELNKASHDEIYVPIKESQHDVAMTTYLNTNGDFDAMAQVFPRVDELKLEALGETVLQNMDELNTAIEGMQAELTNVDAQLAGGTLSKKAIAEATKNNSILKADMNRMESMIKELRGGKKFNVDDATALGMALRETKSGNIVPALRDSGYYVNNEFADSEHLRDISYVWGQAEDITTMFQNIDGGITARLDESSKGVAQKYILAPADSTDLAINMFKNKHTKELYDLLDRFNLGGKQPVWVKVIEQVTAVDASFKTAQIVKLDKIQKIVGHLSIKEQMNLVEAAQGFRAWADDIIRMENVAREARGQKPIKYRRGYLRSMKDISVWNRVGIFGKRVEEVMQKPPQSDFINPNQPFNPTAQARKGGIGEVYRETNVGKMGSDMVHNAGKDIFYTGLIHNTKIHTSVMRNKGLENSAQLIDDWTAEAYAGVSSHITRGIEAALPSPVKKSIFAIRRNLTRAVFPFNIKWNITIQPSSVAFTVLRAGFKASVKGMDVFFSKSAQKQALQTHASIIKSMSSGKMMMQDIGGQIQQNNRYEKSILDNVEIAGSYLLNKIEKWVTLYSVRAGYHLGVRKGFRGRALQIFSSNMGALTQSMYNTERRPAVLRSRLITSFFPFQTFVYQAFNHVRTTFPFLTKRMRAGAFQEIATDSSEGKALMAHRMKAWLGFIAVIVAINMGVDRLTGRKPWVVGSFIPFFSILQGITDPSNPWNSVLPDQYVKEFWTAFEAVIKYDDWNKMRKWFVRYQVIGGTQANRIIDTIIAQSRGEVTDTRGKQLFEVNPEEWIKSLFLGPYSTEGGQAYVDKIRGEENFWETWFGLNVPDRADVEDDVSSLRDNLGVVSEEGEEFDFGDLVSGIRAIRTSVGPNKFEDSDDPLIVGFREADGYKDELEVLMEGWYEEGLSTNEVADKKDEWRKANPDKDAALAFYAFPGRIQTREAYDMLVDLASGLDIPLDLLDTFLPPENIADAHFAYEAAETQAERDLIRLQNPAYDEWGQEAYSWKPATGDVAVKEIDIQYAELDDKWDEPRSDHEQILRDNPEYADARRRRDALGLENFPDEFIETYVEYWNVTAAEDASKYADEWYQMANWDFYNAAVDSGVWTGTRDFTNVPTKDIAALAEQYESLRKPDGKADSAARKSLKEANPALWAFLGLANAPTVNKALYLEWYRLGLDDKPTGPRQVSAVIDRPVSPTEEGTRRPSIGAGKGLGTREGVARPSTGAGKGLGTREQFTPEDVGDLTRQIAALVDRMDKLPPGVERDRLEAEKNALVEQKRDILDIIGRPEDEPLPLPPVFEGWEPNPDSVSDLVGMGFTEEQASEALSLLYHGEKDRTIDITWQGKFAINDDIDLIRFIEQLQKEFTNEEILGEFAAYIANPPILRTPLPVVVDDILGTIGQFKDIPVGQIKAMMESGNIPDDLMAKLEGELVDRYEQLPTRILKQMESSLSAQVLKQRDIDKRLKDWMDKPDFLPLIWFLRNDRIDENKYTATGTEDNPTYVCVDFANDLIEAGAIAPNEVGYASLRGINHAINYVMVNDVMYFIEPQTDEIFTLEELRERYSGRITAIRIYPPDPDAATAYKYIPSTGYYINIETGEPYPADYKSPIP